MIKQSNLVRGVARPTFDVIPFRFGMDLVTPSNQTEPGSLRSAQNVEININGGYTTAQGYERFSGMDRPSDAAYQRMDINITGSLSIGDTLTGSVSGATAELIEIGEDDGQDFLVMTKVVGTFQVSENVTVSATVQASVLSEPVTGGAPTQKLNAQYKNLAADVYRADITEVPGSGKILGVWMYNGDVYAFRNNAGGTAAVMHKSTSGGWSAITLAKELEFSSGGTHQVLDGDVITGATSGATATVARVVLESGSWASGDAQGRLILTGQVGTFVSENLDEGANLNVATITQNSADITLLPNGRYEFKNHNFGGQAGAEKMYGVDGVNRGFEWDGTVFVPINTGMDADTPKHVTVYENHLFYSFDGSAQHSGLSTPYIWSPIFGAAELAVGDTITGYRVQPGSQSGGSLAIFSRNRIHMLYGSSSADWNLVEYREEVGAFPYTIQEFGQTLMMDDRGINSLATVQAFGNFSHGVVSRLIQPFINTRKNRAIASSISREKSQYRLFFSDKNALYVTTENNRVAGIMAQLHTHTVECIVSQEKADGTEESYFGSDDGFVYQMEKGTSHDGSPIDVYFALNFHHAGSPRVLKSYKNAAFEISGTGYSEFFFRTEVGYNDRDIPQSASRRLDANFSKPLWDDFVWDNFVWDGEVLKPSLSYLEGSAENISLIFSSSSDYFEPLTFTGAQLQHVVRKQLRS